MSQSNPVDEARRSRGMSQGAALAWFFGLVLFIGVLIFAFGGSEPNEVSATPQCEIADAGNGVYYYLLKERWCQNPKEYAGALSKFTSMNPHIRLEYVGNYTFIER